VQRGKHEIAALSIAPCPMTTPITFHYPEWQSCRGGNNTNKPMSEPQPGRKQNRHHECAYPLESISIPYQQGSFTPILPMTEMVSRAFRSWLLKVYRSLLAGEQKIGRAPNRSFLLPLYCHCEKAFTSATAGDNYSPLLHISLV